MAEFIEVLSDKAKKDIDELISKLERGTKAVGEINKEFKNIKVPSQASEAIKKTTRSTQQLNEAQKESRRLSRALERQKERLAQASGKVNKALLKTRFETQQVNRLEKQRAIISSRLSTEYQKQQAKINLLNRTYQNLATKQEMGVRLSRKEEQQLKETTAQIQRKQAALKRVDANIGNFQRNVGNYTSAWGRLGNMLKTTIVAFGTFAAIDIVRQVFNQTKEINGLNLALKQVTDSANGFNQALDFIEGLAERTGSEINRLQRAYIKFFAAAKTTNLTLEETQEIFENVSTSASVLGQSSEDTEGALRALEQMLSKGKVQAEEIRGQLGERLPGAFQILAKAMGLTTQQLDKQLELGQVYADEVLPKFARELAKTYSLDNIKKVDNLAAAQGRLGNEWNLFLRDLEGGEGVLSGVFKAILNNITFILSGIREASNIISDVFESFKPLFNTINQIFDSLFGEVGQSKLRKFAAFLLEAFKTANVKLFALALKVVGATLNGILTSIYDVTVAMRGLARAFGTFFAQIASFDLSSPFQSARNIDISALASSFGTMGGKLAGGFKRGFNEVWNFEAAVAPEEDIPRAEKKAEEAGEGLARAIEKGLETGNLSNLIAESLAEITTSGNLEEYNRQMLEAQANTEKLLKTLQQIEDRKLFTDELRSLGDLLYIDTDVLVNSFDIISDKSAELKDKIDATATSIGEIFGGVGQTILENEQIRIENQIALNRDYYDNLINQAQGNQEQQEFLRREQAAKERKLRQEQAENEKKAALFQIAISTATAIVKALPNIPLSIAVGAIGAAKAAIVASRPVPQYKTGRKGGEDEWAVLGDGYKNEPIVDKDGNLKGMSPNRPTMMHLDKGDSVLPDVNRLQDDILSKTMLLNIQASANKMSQDNNQNKQLERLLMAQSYNIERGIIKSLKKAKFVNNNSTSVDLGHEFKLSKYRGK